MLSDKFRQSYEKYLENRDIFEENKHKLVSEWLRFDQIFRPGKQGIVGIAKLRNRTIEDTDDKKYVFKFSQTINYLPVYEYIILSGLTGLTKFCPHFCKVYGLSRCKTEPKLKKISNPFSVKSSCPIYRDVLLMEYISNSAKFYKFIADDNISESVLYSIIKQVMCAISIAQKKVKFTHYDLHSYNVMVKTCDVDTVFLYVLNDKRKIAVPTYGYYPIIIDYGFSYVKDLDSGGLYPSLGYTDIGFTSDRYDYISDSKLFLITVSEEIKRKRMSKVSKDFRQIVKNIFSPLTVDFERGWDNYESSVPVLDVLTNKMDRYNSSSRLFTNYPHYCFDIIQTLINLPLNADVPAKTSMIRPYIMFLNEFSKIETQIDSSLYSLYILKCIVDSVREHRGGYTSKRRRKDTVLLFKKQVKNEIQSVAKFCVFDNIHFERMLCSLILLSQAMKGKLHNLMTRCVKRKNREYSRLRVKGIDDIYDIIDSNIPSKYEYTNRTEIFIMDCDGSKYDGFILTSNQAKDVNSSRNKSEKLYYYYTHQSDEPEIKTPDKPKIHPVEKSKFQSPSVEKPREKSPVIVEELEVKKSPDVISSPETVKTETPKKRSRKRSPSPTDSVHQKIDERSSTPPNSPDISMSPSPNPSSSISDVEIEEKDDTIIITQ